MHTQPLTDLSDTRSPQNNREHKNPATPFLTPGTQQSQFSNFFSFEVSSRQWLPKGRVRSLGEPEQYRKCISCSLGWPVSPWSHVLTCWGIKADLLRLTFIRSGGVVCRKNQLLQRLSIIPVSRGKMDPRSDSLGGKWELEADELVVFPLQLFWTKFCAVTLNFCWCVCCGLTPSVSDFLLVSFLV